VIWLLTAALAASPRFEGVLGAKTNPAGLGLFGNLWWQPADGLDVGPGAAVYFYWYEAQAALRHQLLGGFVVTTLQAAAEPGVFKRADDRDGPRQFMLRPLGRGRVEVNLRNDLLWLYSRSTGWTRDRSWAEYDPFRDQVFPEGVEWSGEQSVALMASPSGEAERKVWFYVETTLEASVDVGWLDQMARGGVILEKLTPTVSVDLDLYYSFMDTAVGGPGALVVVWWSPGPRDR
jgi:hypothetical protein